MKHCWEGGSPTCITDICKGTNLKIQTKQFIVRISLSVKFIVTNLSIEKKSLERSRGGITIEGISMEQL